MTVTLISQFSPNSVSGVIPHKKVWERSKRGKEAMKTTLLIMAAGIGSRFGTGIKQLEPVGLHNEIIMDYSIHDAIEAGFNKIIFVIRKLAKGGKSKLSALYSSARSRSELVATFLAVLELCKANRVEISGDNSENAEIKIIKGHNKK